MINESEVTIMFHLYSTSYTGLATKNSARNLVVEAKITTNSEGSHIMLLLGLTPSVVNKKNCN